MKRAHVRWVVFAGLAAFLPLVYYLAVVGGFLPYGAILLMGLRNIGDSSMRLFTLVHLAVHGAVLFGLAELITRLIFRTAPASPGRAAAILVLILAAIGMLPIYGIAHGQIQWANAYSLYASPTLR